MQRCYLLLIITLLLISPFARAVPLTTAEKQRHHSFYLSWGYNGEWYTRSNVKVVQDGLGNNYTLNQVAAHDHKGWNEANPIRLQITIPQYSYRIGYIFNEGKGLGIEINFDHAKYIIGQDQDIHLTGQLNGRPADTTIRFSYSNGFYYYLNNGANFFLLNLVKRMKIYKSNSNWIRIDALGKAGIGPVVPHVENSLFGKENSPHFQLGGWNIGLEADIKATIYKYVYLEYGAKLDYVRYSGLKIYDGKVRQAFGTFEMLLSLGINIPEAKRKSLPDK